MPTLTINPSQVQVGTSYQVILSPDVNWHHHVVLYESVDQSTWGSVYQWNTLGGAGTLVWTGTKTSAGTWYYKGIDYDVSNNPYGTTNIGTLIVTAAAPTLSLSANPTTVIYYPASGGTSILIGSMVYGGSGIAGTLTFQVYDNNRSTLFYSSSITTSNGYGTLIIYPSLWAGSAYQVQVRAIGTTAQGVGTSSWVQITWYSGTGTLTISAPSQVYENQSFNVNFVLSGSGTISNQPILVYRNGSYIGSALTNSSGTASWSDSLAAGTYIYQGSYAGSIGNLTACSSGTAQVQVLQSSLQLSIQANPSIVIYNPPSSGTTIIIGSMTNSGAGIGGTLTFQVYDTSKSTLYYSTSINTSNGYGTAILYPSLWSSQAQPYDTQIRIFGSSSAGTLFSSWQEVIWYASQGTLSISVPSTGNSGTAFNVSFALSGIGTNSGQYIYVYRNSALVGSSQTNSNGTAIWSDTETIGTYYFYGSYLGLPGNIAPCVSPVGTIVISGTGGIVILFQIYRDSDNNLLYQTYGTVELGGTNYIVLNPSDWNANQWQDYVIKVYGTYATQGSLLGDDAWFGPITIYLGTTTLSIIEVSSVG